MLKAAWIWQALMVYFHVIPATGEIQKFHFIPATDGITEILQPFLILDALPIVDSRLKEWRNLIA